MTDAADRLDRREQRLERLTAAVPYVLLAASTALALLTGQHSPVDVLVILGLVALAAVWIATLGGRPSLGPLYVAGLIVLIGALCARDMWFASFFAFVGYVHSWLRLRGAWRYVGLAATAAISITAFLGPPAATPAAIGVRLLFVAALVALVSLFSHLGDVTLERSVERKRMVEQLEAVIHENEGLHAQLLVQAHEAGVLDERQRIARDIHDTIAQGLAGIITQLQAAERADDAGRADDRRRRIGIATRLARESLTEARRSVHAVGPVQLEGAQLPDALAAVVAEWGERNGVRAEFSAVGPVRPLHPEAEVALLRIAQEALANAGEYARAGRVRLTLTFMDDVVTLDVRDDGVGFDPTATDGGFGLTSMRQRATRLGGTLDLESEPGVGTAISATVPAIPREAPLG